MDRACTDTAHIYATSAPRKLCTLSSFQQKKKSVRTCSSEPQGKILTSEAAAVLDRKATARVEILLLLYPENSNIYIYIYIVHIVLNESW
jgi:hypothetical protein